MMRRKKNTVSYSSKKIHVSNTVAEQEAANYAALAGQDPIERIRETVRLIMKVYGYSFKALKERKPINRINFGK